MDEAREQLMETKRQENFEVSRRFNDQPGRFGLFTSPAPLAVSDPQFAQKKPRVDPNSDVKEVIIDPPNIRTAPIKKGHGDGILFMKASYNAIGDPFKAAATTMLRKEDRKRQIEVGNEKPFKPGKHVKHPVKAAYGHMKEYDQLQKNFRDEENGEVMIQPKNMLTNPAKRGANYKNATFGGNVPYIEDDYNRPKELATQERLAGDALMQEKPFSQKAKQTHLFNSNLAVIGEDREIPHRNPRPKTPPPMEHDKAFKPSNPGKRGYNKSLSPFPKYMEDPYKYVTRKMEEEDEKKKFKPTHVSKSRPTPSIQTNMRNLKASFPSVFRR